VHQAPVLQTLHGYKYQQSGLCPSEEWSRTAGASCSGGFFWMKMHPCPSQCPKQLAKIINHSGSANVLIGEVLERFSRREKMTMDPISTWNDVLCSLKAKDSAGSSTAHSRGMRRYQGSNLGFEKVNAGNQNLE
jgi:hypothetical protein